MKTGSRVDICRSVLFRVLLQSNYQSISRVPHSLMRKSVKGHESVKYQTPELAALVPAINAPQATKVPGFPEEKPRAFGRSKSPSMIPFDKIGNRCAWRGSGQTLRSRGGRGRANKGSL